MRLDPEDRVMAKDADPMRAQRVAAVLAGAEYPGIPWDEIPDAEKFRFLADARTFIAAHDAAKPQGD